MPTATLTKSAVSANQKTYKSVDFSTDCPKRQAGTPCKYCYVETARKSGYNAKSVYSCHYASEVIGMRPATIAKLNAMGGIRLFSFGDYQEWMNADLDAFFADCETVGLKVKAITKQVAFVHKYANRCAVVHVSVDNVGDGVPMEQAKALREQYPTVRIRAAIMSHSDMPILADDVDIITLNHGANGYTQFRKTEHAAYAAAYPGKVCCQTGSCSTCSVRCAVN